MNNYPKLASTLICNWLLKNGCKLKNEASTTESKYYQYGETSIRISCHIPSSCSANSIYIIVPVNNVYSFGVFVGKQYCAVANLKELKYFLNSLFRILDIKAFNELAKINLDIKRVDIGIDVLSQKTQKIDELEAKIANLNVQLKDYKQKISNQSAELTRLHEIQRKNK